MALALEIGERNNKEKKKERFVQGRDRVVYDGSVEVNVPGLGLSKTKNINII